MAISGCGKFDVAHLNLSENGSRGTVLARFFQDQNIYEKELPFRNVNGYAFFEDDIILGRIDKLSVKPLNFVLPSAKTGVLDFGEFSGIQSFAFAIEGGRLWTKGIVPYVITSAVSPATDSLKSAMQAITSNTGIKFVERTNETDYLEFVKSDQENTCGSYVGRQGGAQSVFVQAGAGGCGLAANVHELLHAIGLWHEQSRTDRDNHVEILYDNIIPEYKDQFDILPGVILGAYDFTSVMHYGVTFFSKNGNDTIRSRNGQKIERVVPMSGLDASGVKELYKSELSSGGGGGQCDPAAKGASCGIINGTGQMEDQTCNASTQQWVGGVCRVKTCNAGFQPDSARAACVQSGSNNEAPRGFVDVLTADGVLKGWSYDPNSSATSIDVHYYIDGAFAGMSKADKARSDVNAAFGIAGNHGFEFRVPDSYRNNQTHTIKAYGIDLEGQTNPELGAKTFTLGSGNIACNNANKGGSCNIANGTGQMEDQTCDGTTGNWVGGACRVKTCNSGFEPNSARTSCVASAAPNEAPRGYVDELTADGMLKGWSYDPNSSGTSIDVHYYIDGAFAGMSKADKARSDVNAAFGIAGNHGFEFRVPDSYRNNQAHTIKAYGIDLQGQTNPELGAKTFTLGSGNIACNNANKGGSCNIANGTGQMEDQTCDGTTGNWVGGACRVKTCNSGFEPNSARTSCVASAAPNEAPRGYVDVLTADGVLKGWSYDPNRAATSIDVHYYIDGAFAGMSKADKTRSDVNAAFGIAGNHGFEFRVPDSYRNNQTHTIKAYGIDLEGQTNPELGAKTFTLGSGTPAVTGLSFVSGSYSVGVTGSASNLPETTMWCLTQGSGSCTPNLSRMQDWTSTGSTGNNRSNWKYEIRPYQAGWCPGTFTAVVQAPGETKLTASFTIGYPNTSVSNGGLRVNNVPPPSVGVLKACFEYNQNVGANNPGSCGGRGNTSIINNGWSYNESDHSATFNGNSSVFGGRHGTMFFTFEYNCGLVQTVTGSF